MADTKFPHLFLGRQGESERFVGSGYGTRAPLPPRDRQAHGSRLLLELEDARRRAEELRDDPTTAVGVSTPTGILLEFVSEPGFALAFESLDRRKDGIELRNVRNVEDVTYATVFVPDGRLGVFLKIFDDYLNVQTKIKGSPKNQPLVESISKIRLAALESFWTDAPELFPGPSEAIWWELWLRGHDADIDRFSTTVRAAGIGVDDRWLVFPERTVVLAFGTSAGLSRSAPILERLAELRRGLRAAGLFTSLPRSAQESTIDGFLRRLSPPGATAPAVSILDTGVNRGHRLLEPALDPEDTHTCDPTWGKHDHHGHGTEMAGVALYGDLATVLASRSPVVLEHRIESVKLLPPHGDNDAQFYGPLTIEAVGRVEVQAPNRQRAICLATTVPDYKLRGRPTSWSAALDKLTSGYDDDHRRLLVVSAGNTVRELRHIYPDSNRTASVQDPGQSWNALTIGCFTQMTTMSDPDFAAWRTIAPPGGLGPSSTTSLVWPNQWPSKPDLVLEGGNMILAPDGTHADFANDLQLLTTSYQPQARQFTVTGDTSAATGLAARMAAQLWAVYPRIWPETVRALMIHSAEWTDALRQQFAGDGTRPAMQQLLRCCGFGVPDLQRALWSANNALTLVIEDELQPFDGNKTKDMRLHTLPWPKEALNALGETDVELRVTLSYFIEPNPGERGWTRKFSYMSHGLRFDVNTPEESVREFRKRLNAAARQEDEAVGTSSGAAEWELGPTLRKRGSIHSDRWFGSAERLARRNLVGIYPVIGWWRERAHLGRAHRKARYALVVSIRTPPTTVDVYTPVATRVQVAIPR